MAKIIVPYNEAGKRAFEVITRVAMRIWETAQDAAAEYANKAMPEAQVLGERFDKIRKAYCLDMEYPDGQRETIAYDFRAKTITILSDRTEDEEWENKRQSAYAGSVTEH